MTRLHFRRRTRSAIGLGTLAVATAAAAPVALAHTGATPTVRGTSPAALAAPTCLIRSLPSFIAQGEFATSATVADVLEVECNPALYGTGGAVTITAAQLYSRCHEITWYVPNEPGGNEVPALVPDSGFVSSSGPSVTLHLDVDGNANVALIAGPHCMAGESLVTLDQNEAPYETFTTSFLVLPDVPTPQGLYATPAAQVEDAASSAVATIVQAEFSRAAEAKVRLGAGQLYDRCQRGSHLVWVRENRELVIGPELADEHAIELDNDGNGFALAIGSDSCAEGVSLIEGDLEASPFTTLTAEFAVLPPQPTEEPAFSIEKRQEIRGSGSGFTTAPLTAKLGETVDYEITVTNTSHVAETFTAFSDSHCDPGTIGGGPGSSAVAPGQSTTYTCNHLLTTVGTYVNQATVTGNTVGGRPLVETSNQVEVTVVAHPLVIAEPSFTIEKRQRIGSGSAYTTATLTTTVGATVEYEIVIKNTGNVGLKFSGFSDPNCDPGTLAGGPAGAEVAPGGSTTYTCTRLLPSAGTYTNVATVIGTPPGETSLPPMRTNEVEVLASTTPAPSKHEEPKVAVKAVCESQPHPVLHGAAGQQTGAFTVWVSSFGIARITFYLDGRKLRSFTAAQARHGRFSLKLNARRVRYGVHHVSFQTVASDVNCAATASSRMFFRPRPNLGMRFTG